MNDKALRRIVIVGGGTAGWMAAAPLAQHLQGQQGWPCELVLVESPDIGTIGVGEATLPPIRNYNAALGLDTTDFMKRTQASFKLGIEFLDWGHVGNRFFHGFGDFGPPIADRGAWQHWVRLQRLQPMPSHEDWCTASVMARNHRFAPPQGSEPSAANSFNFAFHFDAGLYAAYLRDYAMQRGTHRVEGTIVEVEQRPEDGFVTALKLADGRRLEGDLFIDCSGMRGLLIEGVMKAGYEDWSHWLPCNSALAVPSTRAEQFTPYTTSRARSAGWLWRIPLQHRTGNGHVYCDGFTSHEDAARTLLEGLDGPALDDPRPVRFNTGMRRKAWVKNVVALGLSGGFLEPLESTSIQLIISGIGALLHNLPDRRCHPLLAEEFNRRARLQYESVRDFIILHYKLTQRRDSEFWKYCAAMSIPDSLQHQIELFRACGRVSVHDPNGFTEPSWVALYLGLGVLPESYDPFVDTIDPQALRQHFERLRSAIGLTVADMPSHAEYVRRLMGAG